MCFVISDVSIRSAYVEAVGSTKSYFPGIVRGFSNQIRMSSSAGFVLGDSIFL